MNLDWNVRTKNKMEQRNLEYRGGLFCVISRLAQLMTFFFVYDVMLSWKIKPDRMEMISNFKYQDPVFIVGINA